MNTLGELVYYCNEEKPVGALLLTGEWGCGKTYLINTQLKNSLKDSHVLLRISLFGISSVEEVKMEVKRKWLLARFSADEQDEKLINSVNKFSGLLKTLLGKATENIPDPAKSFVNGALSLNAYDFINVESKMGKKKVVLIFDDFERSNILTNDLLGCINDYNENQGITTIIVANEDKIKSDADSIKYTEIKEKIIQRTVHHEPEYSSVVESIIHDMEFRTDGYKDFLKKYVSDITTMFSGIMEDGSSINDLARRNNSGYSQKHSDEEDKRIANLQKRRPHNIRSLKCALQEFNRIYDLLQMKEIKEEQNWLFSYIAFVFSARAGLVEKSDKYGTLLSDNTVSILYAGYYFNKSITNGIKEWIINGVWDEERILSELDYVKERDAAIKPEDKVRMNRIFYLEENDVNIGYPKMLKNAYEGLLELNDYVNFLCNRSWAREYQINLPEVDWNKMRDGVRTKISCLLQSQIEQNSFHTIIGEDSKGNFTDDEWSVYEMIKAYRDGDVQLFENNRKQYINAMKKDPVNGLLQMKSKRLNCFDNEMAEVSLEAFMSLPNAKKDDFVSYFKSVWLSNISCCDYNFKISKEAFDKFLVGLDAYLKNCEEQSLSIAAFHTRNLINSIDELRNSKAECIGEDSDGEM